MSFIERNTPFGGPPPRHIYRSDGNSPITSRQLTLPSMSNLLNHVQQPVAHQYQPPHTTSREPMLQPQNSLPIHPVQHYYNPPPPPPPSYFPQPPIEPLFMPRPYVQDSALPYQRSQPIVKRRQFKRAKGERDEDSSKHMVFEGNLSPLQSRSLEPQADHSPPEDVGAQMIQAFGNTESSMSRMPVVNQHDTSRSHSISGLLSGVPRLKNHPPGPKYVLEVRQHPLAARACGFGERDRRVIDPPPILTMEVSDPNASPAQLAVLKQQRQRYAVVHCTLWDPAKESDASTMPTTADRRQQRRLMGTLVSSAFEGKDENNQDGCFFTFPDLSVRTPGRYSLRFQLVIIDPSQMGIPGAQSPIRSIVKSAPFDVFNAKDFKGMVKSTPLAVTLKAQGCLISVKKGSVKSKAPEVGEVEDEDDEDTPAEGDDEGDEDGDDARGTKRSRT